MTIMAIRKINRRDKTAERTIKKVLRRHLDFDRTLVFLFGSRAGRFEKFYSDFDIGIYQGRPVPMRTVAKIKEDLEECPIPFDIDIVDFAAVDKEFKRLALKKVKIWNRPKKDLKLI